MNKAPQEERQEEQIVDIPGMGEVAFPANMTDEEIVAAIENDIMPTRTGGERAGRAAGVATRGAITGATAIPALALTPLTSAINQVSRVGQAAEYASGGHRGEYRPINIVQSPTEAVRGALDASGLPQAETAGERVLQTTMELAAAGGPLIGAGRRLAAAAPETRAGYIGEVLGQAPGRQTALGGLSGLTLESTREMGADEITANAAAVASSILIPAGLTQIGRTAANRFGETMRRFQAQGIEPSASMVTGNPVLRSMENFFGKFPGGQGVMLRHQRRVQEAFERGIQTGVSAEQAGRAIRQGITGDSGFMERTSSVFRGMDEALTQRVGDSAGYPANTVRTLEEMNALIPGLENTSLSLRNARMVELGRRLQNDLTANRYGPTRQEAVPFSGLRQLRTIVGEQVEDALISGTNSQQYKRLYGALTRDMEAIAALNGAGQQFARQNAYWTARMSRVEDVLNRVLGRNSTPEEIFLRINPTNPDEVNLMRSTLRSLEPGEREVVARAVVDRLGRTSGNEFSSFRFLENWNSINPRLKNAMFSEEQIAHYDDMARLARNIGQTSDDVGMGHGLGHYAVFGSVGGGALGLLHGAPDVAAAGFTAASSIMVGSNISARLLTNQRFLNWATSMPRDAQRLPEHMARLAVLYAEERDPATRRDLEYLISGTMEDDD